MPSIEFENDEEQPNVSKQVLNDEEREKLAEKLDKELDDFINVLAEKSVCF